jgi:hypothetical protein
MISIKLFEASNDRIFCMKLAARLDERFTRNPELKEVIRSVSKGLKTEPRLSSDNSKTVSGSLNNADARLDKTRLDKKTKEKKKFLKKKKTT